MCQPCFGLGIRRFGLARLQVEGVVGDYLFRSAVFGGDVMQLASSLMGSSIGGIHELVLAKETVMDLRMQGCFEYPKPPLMEARLQVLSQEPSFWSPLSSAEAGGRHPIDEDVRASVQTSTNTIYIEPSSAPDLREPSYHFGASNSSAICIFFHFLQSVVF